MSGEERIERKRQPRREETADRFKSGEEQHGEFIALMNTLEETVRTSKLRGGVQAALIRDLRALTLLHMGNLGSFDPKSKIRLDE